MVCVARDRGRLWFGESLRNDRGCRAIAANLLQLAGDNPWPTLVVVYGITTLLTELITNNAAAALMFPISVSLANTLGVDVMPFVIAIMIGASASFRLPSATKLI